MLLKDKVALITGGGSGIGAATAKLFAREGANVVVVDVNDAGGQETVRSIQQCSGEAAFFGADVGHMSDVDHSNAAAYKTGAATEISEEDWDTTQAVCLKATWMIARCALPRMIAHGGGVFVITGSVHAIRGYAKHAAYQAAKGGLAALTRSLAADYAPSVRVNAILPGAVVTGLWTGIPEEERARIAQMCPLGRNGRPEEIAQVALFLASDMSAFMTGSSVVVDGGLTAVMHGL
jgi:NAD(P)-dependent dehydrogenase (short-subunit alcohol dehydrogenase family)